VFFAVISTFSNECISPRTWLFYAGFNFLLKKTNVIFFYFVASSLAHCSKINSFFEYLVKQKLLHIAVFVGIHLG